MDKEISAAVLGFLCTAAVAYPAAVQSATGTSFADVTTSAGIASNEQTSSGGACWGDYDGDGQPDLFLDNHGREPYLYKNMGNGRFLDVRASVMGLPQGMPYWGDRHGCAWADFDNDGDQDLAILVGAEVGMGDGPKQLYVNQDGLLEDQASAYGVDYPPARGRTPVWLDYDRDGLLDLFEGAYLRQDGTGDPTLFHQVTEGFIDVRDQTGLLTVNSPEAWLSDVTGDGQAELLLKADLKNPPEVPGFFRILDISESPFRDITPLNFGVVQRDDVLLADFDGDLDVDIYLATAPANAVGGADRPDALYRNDGDTFTNVADPAGINTILSTSTSALAADFDNDMDLDIFLYRATHGPFDDPAVSTNVPNVMLWNQGDGTFVSELGASGATGTLEGTPRSATAVDYDGDGFVDIFLNASFSRETLWRNLGNGNHWIEIDLVGTRSNRDAIGAQIFAVAGGVTQLREQNGGVHRDWAQNHSRIHFGLGANLTVDELQIRWPSGVTQTLSNVSADRVLRVVEPESPMLMGEVAVDHQWASVELPTSVTDPVVLLGPPTYRGNNPGVVRVRDVAPSGFQVRFQEWDYRERLFADRFHVEENIPYLALEAGRRQMTDGSVWEVGTFEAGGTQNWAAMDFSVPFAAPPYLFLTVQTESDAHAVSVRARNVTAKGFEAALFEEEASNEVHAPEIVGYLAISSRPGSGLAEMSGSPVPYLLQQAVADQRWIPALSQRLKVEEEDSVDGEHGHVDETLHVLAFGRRIFAQQVSDGEPDPTALRRLEPTADAPIEWGLLRGITQNWRVLPFAKSYRNPVLVTKPVSNIGPDPGTIRIQGLSRDHAQLRYQEWTNLDDRHVNPDNVFYLVCEAGQHLLGGLNIEAGRVVTDKLARSGNWEQVAFGTSFDAGQAPGPAVIASVMTDIGQQPVITRITGLTPSGFMLAMDEEEARNDGHYPETLGWIAIAQGSGATTEGRQIQVFLDNVADVGKTLPYPVATRDRYPAVIADVDSSVELDPMFLRYTEVTPTQVKLKLAEETTADNEVHHMAEDVGVFVGE